MGALKIQLNQHLLPMIKTHRRFKIIHGGRGSGKSHTVAVICALRCGQGQKVACLREYQGSIKDSVYSIIKRLIEHYGLTGFEFTQNEIRHESGGLIVFYGFARHAESIKGLDDFSMAWIEEAQTISEDSLQLLTPTFRGAGAEMWFTLNPKRVSDPISQRFIERKLPNKEGAIEWDELIMRARINYTENSMFPPELESERLDDFKRLDRALYLHIWEGAYNDSVKDSIIKAEWFECAINAHKIGDKYRWRPFGQVVGVHDPADTGDARGTVVKHGNIVLATVEDLQNQINDACTKSMELARQHKATHFIYDADGPGLGLRSQVKEFWDSNAKIYEFRGGQIAENPDESIGTDSAGREILNRQFYKNLRSQCYHRLSQRFEKTYRAVERGEYIDPHELISLSSDCENLSTMKSELTSIPRVYNSNGTFQVMPKKQMMEKLKMASPNIGDCMMMGEISLRSNKARKKRYADLDFA